MFVLCLFVFYSAPVLRVWFASCVCIYVCVLLCVLHICVAYPAFRGTFEEVCHSPHFQQRGCSVGIEFRHLSIEIMCYPYTTCIMCLYMSCYTVSLHDLLHCVVTCLVALCCYMSCYTVSLRVLLHCVITFLVTLCHCMSCYTVLLHVLLCCVITYLFTLCCYTVSDTCLVTLCFYMSCCTV